MVLRSPIVAFTLAVLATCSLAGAADAGWVSFKNTTPKAVIVQEFILVNGKKVCGKPYKLLPGESFREFQSNPGVKHYEVFDAASSSLWVGQLNCKGDMQVFAITAAGGKAAVVPITPMADPKQP